jgi:molybdopterin molybdotransferase
MSGCCAVNKADFAFDSPGEALDALCARLAPVGHEAIAWEQAAGRVLAQGAAADRASPSCDVSAMDGYALRWADCKPGTITVAGEVQIGEPMPRMPVGKAIKIVTGAPVPEGADVVVRREDTVEHEDSIELPEALVKTLKPEANIRRMGENMAAGTVVECKGRLVTAPVMGMLTTFGLTRPEVFKQVRLGIITTGNEVVPPETTPTQWQLRDSNASSLLALCAQHRWIHLEARTHARDTVDAIESTARDLLGSCDALVFTGGVSMGDHDHVPAIVESLGAQTVFHKLPQRPGKPVLGAVLDGKPIFGLPGNPVSVMVTAHRMLIPALAVRGGLDGPTSTPRMVRVINADDKTLGLWWRRPAKIVGADTVALVSTKGSGDVPSAAMSDGFVELEPGQSGAGPWPFWSWSG